MSYVHHYALKLRIIKNLALSLHASEINNGNLNVTELDIIINIHLTELDTTILPLPI